MSHAVLVTICLIGMSATVSAARGQALAPAANVPEPPKQEVGQRLLELACTQCHGLRPITLTRDGPGGWSVKVHKMIAWGAQINNEAEAQTLIDYLVRTYGPSAGPMTTGPLPPGSVVPAGASSDSHSIVLPAGHGAPLVQGLCGGCHDLGRIVATRRTPESWRQYTTAMLEKGRVQVPTATARAISDYLATHFGIHDER
jgi:hypothetical protein